MARKVAVSKLNASTVDILNTIRQNASYAYQSSIPVITTAHEIPALGEMIYGYPALANEFIAALVNQIALVRIKTSTFNNDYEKFKKGYLEYGESVEEVFVNIAKAREFSAEKAEARELKRSLPDVRSAFHCMNWNVQYPVTIQDEDLRLAFRSEEGIQDLIAKIVDSVYRADSYDTFLLFKYLLIKAISHGQMHPVKLGGSAMSDAAVSFRGASNLLQFMSDKYNAAGVHTNTPREDQYIFMDAAFNAAYDVSVLASAFNMDKAEFQGKLQLIDDWTTFDNDRFDQIRAGSDQIEEVTSAELALMADVKAVLVDAEWFQVYDNVLKFTEKYVASGMYWNYFLNVRRTVSSSPFSNAVVFLASSATITAPASIDFIVDGISTGENAKIFTLVIDPTTDPTYKDLSYNFVEDSTAVTNGIAVHKYGAVIMPTSDGSQNQYQAKLSIDGVGYTASTKLTVADAGEGASAVTATAVGDKITFAKDA